MRPAFARMKVLALICVVTLLVYIVRLSYMVSVTGDNYATRANVRSTKTITLYGKRGTIFDKNMVPLAYDRGSYDVTFYRDPTRNSDADRLAYTKTLIQVVKLVESNGKSCVNNFWLKKGDNGYWYFDSGSGSETVEATRERQWRSNFYLSKTDERELYPSLLEKYCFNTLFETGELDRSKDEELIVKVLALWQESRMNAFNSTPVSIAYDVGYETVSEIEVRSLELLGVDVVESSSRIYPKGRTACHVTGYISKISQNQLETYRSQGYPNDAYIGSDGIEKSLEDQLSPYIEYRHGERVVEVDTRGKAVRELEYTTPIDGNSVVLTIDVDLEEVMTDALKSTIESIPEKQEHQMAREHWQRENEDVLKKYNENNWDIDLAESGAMVAMDPYTGRVLGMVSYPDYDLSIFNNGKVDDSLWSEAMEGNDPLYNRAVSTKDAPGSIFKLCTSLAGLSEGAITTETRIDDMGGFYKTNQTNPAKCWTSDPMQHQNQTIVEGLKNSCNYFFYEVSYRLGNDKLYQWAAALGLTSKTNIELPGEATSIVGNQHMLYDPDNSPTWQNTAKPLLTYEAIKESLTKTISDRGMNITNEVLEKAISDLMRIAVSYDKKTDWYRPIREILQYDLGLPANYISSHYMVNTYVTYLADLFWTPNETIMVGIGQSVTQTTPIAIARYVSAIVNGGTVYDAQIVDKIIAPDGSIVIEKQPVIANQINTNGEYYAAIRRGMEEVTDEVAGGTASKYFSEAKYSIAAKTGTSQRTELDVENNSWIVTYAPADDPKIVVVCYIQNGYSGAYSSPAVIKTIEYYLDSLKNTESTTATQDFTLAEG